MVCSMKTALDAGSDITVISMIIAQNLNKVFPDFTSARTMDPPHSVRVVDGCPLRVAGIACPVRITVHTSYGSVTLDALALTGSPAMDNVLILGCPTPEGLGLDTYAG